LSTDLFACRDLFGATLWPATGDKLTSAIERLSEVFYVARYSVINGIALVIEIAIVVPVHVAVGREVFADNCAGNVWTAIDCENGSRGIKYRREASGCATAGV
jgi:hypothetical protein